MNPHLFDVIRRVKASGGSVRQTSDGHLLVFGPEGQLLAKFRTAGKKVGDINKLDRDVLDRIEKKLREEKR